MSEQYLQIPPPDKRYYIVYPTDISYIRYGELTNIEYDLGYNYENIQIYEDKQKWIERLLSLGIQHPELEDEEDEEDE